RRGEPVCCDAPLLQPLRFREGISALHDVVISDLRFKPRDKTAYEEWKRNERSRLASLRLATYQQAQKELLRRPGRPGTAPPPARGEKTDRPPGGGEPVPPDLEKQFNRCRKRYWNARMDYSA